MFLQNVVVSAALPLEPKFSPPEGAQEIQILKEGNKVVSFDLETEKEATGTVEKTQSCFTATGKIRKGVWNGVISLT